MTDCSLKDQTLKFVISNGSKGANNSLLDFGNMVTKETSVTLIPSIPIKQSIPGCKPDNPNNC